MTKRTCSVEGCDGKHLARGLCSKHYQRLKHSGDFSPQPKPDPERRCSVDDCSNHSKLKGMCEKHYHRMRRHGTTDDSIPKAAAECSIEGCTALVRARGLCALHVGRWYRTGSTDPGPIDPFRRCTKRARELPWGLDPRRARCPGPLDDRRHAWPSLKRDLRKRGVSAGQADWPTLIRRVSSWADD